MLGDSDLQGLDGRLNTFVQSNKQQHESQEKLLLDFQELIENYRQLKSDYEEEKESREKYKKMARGQERNPFTLVLIDGDNYIFKDRLIQAGSDGGITAAQLLSTAIKRLLQSRLDNDTDQCRVMVRIYANLAGLSKTLARNGLVGHESRSLSTFAASFTRSQDLFDFVDAGDKKEGADFKIREIFRLFAENNQCKHIFFAGCHDVGYLSMLTPYRGKGDHVTLIKGASFHPEFETLDLPVRELPSCFKSTSFSGSGTSTTYSPVKPNYTSNSATMAPASKVKVCKFWQKGHCRYGADCANEHTNKSLNGSGAGDPSHRQSSRLLPPSPGDALDTGRLSRSSFQDYRSYLLPINTPATENLIPVNKDGDRLETISTRPSQEAWNVYQKRANLHKVCNKYHLSGKCDDEHCKFDHNELEPESLKVLQYILKEKPCVRGSACRLAKCYSGHVCQRDGCRGPPGCRFKLNKHAPHIDFSVAEWVTPVDAGMEGETEESDEHDELEENLLLDSSPQEDSSIEDGGVKSWLSWPHDDGQ